MAGIDFEKALNKEQLAAVMSPDAPALVLAAAGTGKTRTLVYRVARLVERGVDPAAILLLTFTNKAAREMLERAKAVVGPTVGGVWGGTFHHMANRLLRIHAPLLNYKHDFTILDRDDSLSIISRCMKECKVEDKEFPKRDILLSLFSSSANTEAPLESIVERRLKSLSPDTDAIIRIHRMYTEKKRQQNAMDFDDLLVNCLALLRNHERVLARYREQFKHVLVDEYQDTNTIQAEIVDLVAQGSRNILVVGDDFQSIYSWRGANYMNIMSFPERYPDAQIYKLETNYRSVPEILEVANACIAGNPRQYQKTLRPTRDSHRKPSVVRLRDGGEQARYVVEQIRTLCRNGYRMRDIAVLYRAHFHAMELQIEMTRQRMAHVITSGVRFFEQAHIKDACAIPRIVQNPGDETAFIRLMGMLPGVGDRTAEKLWDKLGHSFDARDQGRRRILLESLKPASRAVAEHILSIFTTRKDEDVFSDTGELIHRFCKAFYERYATETYEDFSRRLEDISELILYTAKFETMATFLADIALLTNLDAEIENVGPNEKDAVRLSTVHQAKGLEWSAVILLWVTDGMFPSSRSMNESVEGEAEERRLFYVAVTRAKDELCLCVPEVRRNKDGGVIYCPPSRFIEEIPRKFVREIRPGLI